MSFAGQDPVAEGWIASLSRPGGNVTGVMLLGPELDGKRLELLHEAVPDRRRIAVLVEPGGQAGSIQAMRPVAQALALELVLVPVVDADYAAAFAAIRAMSAGAVAVPSSAVLFRDTAKIAALAAENGLPTICHWAEMAQAGCLLGYGASLAELRRRTAHYVARILRGASPGDLPVEQPSVFELAINARTAKRIAVSLPPSFLARADEVIE